MYLNTKLNKLNLSYFYTKTEAIIEHYSALLKQFLSTIFDKTTVNNLCQNFTPCIFPFLSNIPPPLILYLSY